MHFDKSTIDRLKRLAQDGRFDYFFDAAKEKIEDEDAQEIINELATILVSEFNLSWESLDKVKYFIGLGYHAHK